MLSLPPGRTTPSVADLFQISALTFASNCSIPGYQPLYGPDRKDLDQVKSRLETFICWPRWAPTSLQIHKMSEAGLYYTGDADQTRCFSCSVSISNWKDGDDPWIVHRNRSPTCLFLNQSQTLAKQTSAHNSQSESYTEDNVDGANFKPFHETPTTKIETQSNNQMKQFLDKHPTQEHKDGARKTLQIKVEKHEFCGNEETRNCLQPALYPINKKFLKEENKRLRTAMMCRQCNKEKVQTLFLPCRHLVSCEECAEQMNDCILCNEKILGTVRTYFG